MATYYMVANRGFLSEQRFTLEATGPGNALYIAVTERYITPNTVSLEANEEG